MKRKIYILLILLFTLNISNKAQVLYEVSGNGCLQKSYILATNKLADQSFLDTIPNVFHCYNACSSVITEFAIEDYQAISTLRQAALLPDSIQLSNFYSEQEYEYINQSLLLSLQLGLDKLGRMKPSYLTELYRNEMLKQWLNYDESRSMETFFAEVALQNNKSVIGLDKIGETMYMLFDREPFEYQCNELKNCINYPEREVNIERTLLEQFKNGRLNDMTYTILSPDNQSTLSYSDYQIYAQRNQIWAKRLIPYLKKGGCFITLNALYLGGDKGLISVLRAAGYRVRPVNRILTNHKNI